MIPVDLAELRSVLNGDFVLGTGAGEAHGVTTDSRKVRKGDLFFAIRGKNQDGHAFIEEALKKGAAAAVVDREVSLPRKGQVFRVRDSVAALGDLARRIRSKAGVPVIAITGSNGKTTTKDMVAHILAPDRHVLSSEKSYNNHLGLPITLLGIEKETDVVVVECGTSMPGEIAYLAGIANPNISVVTTVSETHLEGFGTIDAIAREKQALIEKVNPGGTAILNLDNEHTRRMTRATAARVTTFGFFRGADVKEAPSRAGPRASASSSTTAWPSKSRSAAAGWRTTRSPPRRWASRWASTWCRFPSGSRRSAFRPCAWSARRSTASRSSTTPTTPTRAP